MTRNFPEIPPTGESVTPIEADYQSPKKALRHEVRFGHALAPVLLLFALIGYGMVVGPLFLDQEAWPLEFTFLLAALCTMLMLFWLGFDFQRVQNAMSDRTRTALPAIYMLMAIGVLIGSWTASGTIPMLVHYGMLFINPHWLYVIAFLLTSLFSLLTGTSWGSAGTIGVVVINIGMVTDANLGILAAAIISGAYFGDKMSPLSDTTNMAALGAGVPLYSHVRSMVNTTGPSYLLALVIYVFIGVTTPGRDADVGSLIGPTADALAVAFDFNPLVLLPLLVIALGALWRKPPLPTLLISSAAAALIALWIQKFSFADMFEALINGVTGTMVSNAITDERALSVIERGGLYSMSEAVVITLTVFMFIGSMDVIDAMGRVVRTIFAKINTRSSTILASLFSSAVINGFTSNQYATAFIVGDAFGRKYDDLGIPRKVLSRSIEDYGTFIEPMLPWTTSGIYMVATLGVAYGDYVPFMFLNLINFVIAPLLAITGIGCFYNEAKKRSKHNITTRSA